MIYKYNCTIIKNCKSRYDKESSIYNSLQRRLGARDDSLCLPDRSGFQHQAMQERYTQKLYAGMQQYHILQPNSWHYKADAYDNQPRLKHDCHTWQPRSSCKTVTKCSPTHIRPLAHSHHTLQPCMLVRDCYANRSDAEHDSWASGRRKLHAKEAKGQYRTA